MGNRDLDILRNSYLKSFLLGRKLEESLREDVLENFNLKRSLFSWNGGRRVLGFLLGDLLLKISLSECLRGLSLSGCLLRSM